MKTPNSDFRAILEALAVNRVDCIVIGGVGAVLQGAPINTFDLDIIHSRKPANQKRLFAVLQELDMRFRDLAGRVIRPKLSDLGTDGHLLMFGPDVGRFDVLGTVGDGLSYEDLLPHSVKIRLGMKRSVRILNLEKLIELKEAAGRDKDKAVLPILRRTLEEKRRRQK